MSPTFFFDILPAWLGGTVAASAASTTALAGTTTAVTAGTTAAATTSLAATTAAVTAGTTAAVTTGAAAVGAGLSTQMILAGLSVASTFAQGLSSMMAGNQNSAFAKAESEQERMVARQASARLRQQNNYKLSEFRAGVGAQGTTFEGSPMLAYLENVKQSELEVQDVLKGGRLRARSKLFEADMSRAAGISSAIGSAGRGFGLASSLLH